MRLRWASQETASRCHASASPVFTPSPACFALPCSHPALRLQPAAGGAGGGRALDAYRGGALAQPTGGGDALSSLFGDPFFSSFGLGDALAAPFFGEQMQALQQRVALPTLKMDIRESDSAIELLADAPGLSKGEVSLDLNDQNVLTITCEKAPAPVDETREDVASGWKYHRMERASGMAVRRVKLPAYVDASGIKAKVENGVLRVNIPKLAAQADKSRKITVE